MTPKNCVITIKDGGRKLYWNGKSWSSLWNVAALYTLTGAKKKGAMLADHYGVRVTVEDRDARLTRGKNPTDKHVPPDLLGERITNFYAHSVGKTLDTNKEFTLLTEWRESIKREQRDNNPQWYKSHLKAMMQECEAYLDAWGRRKNPVPASSRAGKHTAGKSSVDKAADLFQRFTGNKAHKKARTVNEKDQAFLQVGTVDGVLYTTNRDGKVEQYIHHFRPASRPALAVSADGKVARTVGGRFTFTERGFVDEDRDGKAVE